MSVCLEVGYWESEATESVSKVPGPSVQGKERGGGMTTADNVHVTSSLHHHYFITSHQCSW